MLNPVEPAASAPVPTPPPDENNVSAPPGPGARPIERGGPPGPEPTRYGDWERNGRCIDF